jgi:hypothetical protein
MATEAGRSTKRPNATISMAALGSSAEVVLRRVLRSGT